MLLPLANSPAPRQRSEKHLVDVLIERRKLQPFLQIAECFIIGNRVDKMLQQRGVTAAEAAALCREPAVEDRAAVNLETFQKVSIEQRRQHAQPLRRERLDTVLSCPSDLDRIHEAIG